MDKQMRKPTIKDLEKRISDLTRLITENANKQYSMNEEINRLRADNETLKADKQWLKSMHSGLLQATAEMFRNR